MYEEGYLTLNTNHFSGNDLLHRLTSLNSPGTSGKYGEIQRNLNYVLIYQNQLNIQLFKIKANLRDNAAMERHLNLLIWILSLKSTKGQVLFNDLDDRQQDSLDSALYMIKNELQLMTNSVEKMLLQKLEVENKLQAKINTRIENVTKNAVECHPVLISGMNCTYINS